MRLDIFRAYARGELNSPQAIYRAALAAECEADQASSLGDRLSGGLLLRGSALDRLRWRGGGGNLAHHAQADWWSVPAPTRRFAGRVLKKAWSLSIPLYVEWAWSDRFDGLRGFVHRSGWAVRFGHCRYFVHLSADEWLLIEWLARSVIDPGDRLDLLCPDDTGLPPGTFVLDGRPWVGDWYPHETRRLTPRSLLSA